jgi:hypothetical protein
MRIYISPFVILDDRMLSGRVDVGTPKRERSRICEVPLERAYFFHIAVLLMPSHPIRYLPLSMLCECCAVMAARREGWSRLPHSVARTVSA